MKKSNIVIVAVAVAIVGGTAWYLSAGAGTAAGPGGAGKGGAQPPTVVSVVAALRQDVPVTQLAHGSVTPISSVDLHPQTTATIRAVPVKEGQFVKAGELMFALDDRSDRAGIDKAAAQVARDVAALADAERQYKRSVELAAQQFSSQSQVDTLKSGVDAARALRDADQAALQSSRVSASYTAIRAPMAGRVGAINVYPGSLVQPSTSLTTVTQLNPITVAFTLPESSLAGLLAAQKRGPVTVQAAAGGNPMVDGKLVFIDNAVDASTGTIRVKAQFDNRDTTLWPGQYVSTKVTVETLKDAIVVPQTAIISNTRGVFVYVVDADQTAKVVPVKRLYSFGLLAAVSGLAGDEKIINEGKQNLRPGGKIKVAEPHEGKKAAQADTAEKGKAQ
jgi:multidrug efflux system membrane fusion protein